MLSTHIPGLAGDVVAVTGTLIVDTGLRNMQSCCANLQAAAMTANEEATVSWEELPQLPGSTVKVKLYVWKGGTASGSAGDSAVNVSWIAMGD